MNSKKISRLVRAAMVVKITPSRTRDCWTYPIIGFDTEYTSKQNKLICFQLWHKNNGQLIQVKSGELLTPEWIYDECVELLGFRPPHVLLVTYFSLAELQFLPLRSEGINLMEYARGSLDASFLVDHSQIHIFDLMRWFDGRGLSDAAEAMGYDKLKADRSRVTRASLRSKRFQDYALKDAQLCHDIMQDLRGTFLNLSGVDPVMARTPAAASARTFRNLYVRKKIYCDNNDARILAMRGAWGGRAEVFKRGRLKGTFAEYDIISAYPNSAVKIGVFPVQKSWREIIVLHKAWEMHAGFVKVWFQFSESTKYPSLPVFCEKNQTLLYPLCGVSYCTLAELRMAYFQQNANVLILEGWGYNRGTSILKDYMQVVMEQRANAKGASRVMYKLLANALIGKFAQSISKLSLKHLEQFAKESGMLIDELLTMNTSELEAAGVASKVSVGPVFMPEWNGLITGYTRAALGQMIISGNAVYCHTDSVWCENEPDVGALPFDVRMKGKVTICRTRLASIGNRDMSHLARHSVHQKRAGEYLLKHFDGHDFQLLYKISRPLKFREAVRRDDTPGRWVQEDRKAQTTWCNKRCLLEDGLNTRPWRDLDEYRVAMKLKKSSKRVLTVRRLRPII